MENQLKNEKRLFTTLDLELLKNALPGHYKREFDKIWVATYKGIKPPIRQNVYAVLNGISENDRILTVLIAVVEKRNDLRAKLQNATSGAKRLEATAAN